MSPAKAGKVVVATGAPAGIGRAARPRLLKVGWNVFGLDVARDRLAMASQTAFVPQG